MSAGGVPGDPCVRAGGWSVEPLHDGFFSMPAAGFLVGAGAPEGDLRIDVNAFLLRREGYPCVLVDAGIGPGAMPGLGGVATALAARGVAPNDIGMVLLTHLHLDHCGGLFDAAGDVAFAGARIALAAREGEFWLGDGACDPQNGAAAHRVLERCLDHLLDIGALDLPEIAPVPLPGHTPGHTGFRIGSGESALLIWGDVLNVPGRQDAEPALAVASDVDPALAARTRIDTLARAAHEGFAVAGMHLRPPGFFQVSRAGKDGFALVPYSPSAGDPTP